MEWALGSGFRLCIRVWGRAIKEKKRINEAGQQGKEDLGGEGERNRSFFYSFTGFLSEDNFYSSHSWSNPLPLHTHDTCTHTHPHTHTHRISLYPAKRVKDEGQDLE